MIPNLITFCILFEIAAFSKYTKEHCYYMHILFPFPNMCVYQWGDDNPYVTSKHILTQQMAYVIGKKCVLSVFRELSRHCVMSREQDGWKYICCNRRIELFKTFRDVINNSGLTFSCISHHFHHGLVLYAARSVSVQWCLVVAVNEG